MRRILDLLYKNHSLIYKAFLYIGTVLLIVYFFPKGGKFPYSFQKGMPWQYETLVAPFSFEISKSPEELLEQEKVLRENNIPYFEKNSAIAEEVLPAIYLQVDEILPDTTSNVDAIKLSLSKISNTLYQFGILEEDVEFNEDKPIHLKSSSEVRDITFGNLVRRSEINDIIYNQLLRDSLADYRDNLSQILYENLKADVRLNESLTAASLAEDIADMPKIHGVQEKGFKIIAKGEVVEGVKLNTLNSLKSRYESQDWNESNYNWIVLGYFILVALAIMMLMLFIRKYRSDTFENNTKLTFIIFNLLLMIGLTTLAVRSNVAYIYVVPICIMPIILKAFFDARLGLFTHVITVLILGFMVPNGFEYVFLQIIAGIVTILTVSELYKRVNLFISVGQIVLIYIVAYFAFYIIREGDILYFTNIIDSSEAGDLLRWQHLGRYILCGVAMLFVQPLIYVFEKVFGLVSDVSLLELSDTNSKLLKRLENEAPGTFHHSLNVANLAEAAANEIGANAMLVRVGALYHDIGKIKSPLYFTENQRSSASQHDDLSPRESAAIIINHVIDGIEIAKKNNLPDRVIDFIRTHHGTSTVYYFYKMAMDQEEDVNKEDFQYPGPAPFSKETAILMMCDSVEAASKSLKEPTAVLISDFVEKIIDKQVLEGQFLNADITFKEIEIIKKVLKRKLNNIFHLRIEYPD